MTEITRKHTGPRMSQIVTHGDTIYLAGQVGTAGASVAQQTKDCLEQIDTLLAILRKMLVKPIRDGRVKTDEAPVEAGAVNGE